MAKKKIIQNKQTDSVKAVKNEKKFVWISIIRIIACFLIVVNHTGLYLFDYAGTNKTSVAFYSAFFALCKIGVPIFIMISGYLLLKKDLNYKYIFKKIIKIIVPLLVLSFYSYSRINGFQIDFIFAFLKDPIVLLFWYLYMLIGLYLVAPFVQKMIRNFRHADYRNFILICLIIPGALIFVDRIFHIPTSGYFKMALFPNIIAFFIAGNYLCNIARTKRNRNIAWCTFVIPLLYFFYHMYHSYVQTGSVSYLFDNWAIITSSLPALSLFYLIHYYFEGKDMNEVLSKGIQLVAAQTFGIYLFHYLVPTRILNFGIMQMIMKWNPYLGVLALQCAVFVGCGIVTYIFKHIPLVKKFL